MSNRLLSFGRVFLIQLRLQLRLGWRRRAIGFSLIFVQLVAIMVFGVILGVTVNEEGVAFTPVSVFGEVLDVAVSRSSAALLVSLGALAIIAWFGPFTVWDEEPPSRRGYHWAMPVAKTTHDLARVLAGLTVLIGWAAALYGGVAILGVFGDAGGLFAGWSVMGWLCLFLGPVLLYLLTSVFTVRLEHPTGWVWSLIGCLAALTTFSALLGLQPLLRVLETLLLGRYGLVSAVTGPIGADILGLSVAPSATWPAAWLVWCGALCVAVTWAARDRRRLP